MNLGSYLFQERGKTYIEGFTSKCCKNGAWKLIKEVKGWNKSNSQTAINLQL